MHRLAFADRQALLPYKQGALQQARLFTYCQIIGKAVDMLPDWRALCGG